MGHLFGRLRRRSRPILLGTLLVVALLATLALAPPQARTRVDAGTQALTVWLWPTGWVWPLAAVLTLAALSTLPAKRRWPRPARRIPPAIGVFAGLVGLASLATVSRPGVGLLALGVVVAVGLLALWVLVVPRRLAPPVPDDVLRALKDDRERLEVADARTKLQNDVRTTALQAVAGLAVLAGAVLAFQQLTEDRQQAAADRELTRQGQASERFTRAISQLGSDRREVQLGGIYGLEQIAQQAPDNRLAVTEVLVAYLHRRVPRPAKPRPDASLDEELRVREPDVQAALTVLGRRQIVESDPRLDLRGLDLRQADLSYADLSGADLSGTDLRNANLYYANLESSDLINSDLRNARLRHANLYFADLTRATLRGARVKGARIDTNLRYANFGNADLSYADLRDAWFVDVSFRDARLWRADFTGAWLRTADLRDAYLASATLRGAEINGAQLRAATADQRTTWPDGFDWQGAGVQLG